MSEQLCGAEMLAGSKPQQHPRTGPEPEQKWLLLEHSQTILQADLAG